MHKIPSFHRISWCENFVKRTVSTEFRVIHPRICGNYAFTQIFYTRKLGEIMVFCGVINPLILHKKFYYAIREMGFKRNDHNFYFIRIWWPNIKGAEGSVSSWNCDTRNNISFLLRIICFMYLTHFSPMSHFYTPWKSQKTIGFLTFSEGIKMWHWTKMG